MTPLRGDSARLVLASESQEHSSCFCSTKRYLCLLHGKRSTWWRMGIQVKHQPSSSDLHSLIKIPELRPHRRSFRFLGGNLYYTNDSGNAFPLINQKPSGERIPSHLETFYKDRFHSYKRASSRPFISAWHETSSDHRCEVLVREVTKAPSWRTRLQTLTLTRSYPTY